MEEQKQQVMDPNEALRLVDGVIASVPLNRESHNQITLALQSIALFVKRGVETLSEERQNDKEVEEDVS